MRSEGHKYHIFSTQGLMAQNLGGMTNILCRVVAWAWLWLLFSWHHWHWRTSFIVFVAHPKSSGDLRLWKWFLKHLAWISCQWYNLVTSYKPTKPRDRVARAVFCPVRWLLAGVGASIALALRACDWFPTNVVTPKIFSWISCDFL